MLTRQLVAAALVTLLGAAAVAAGQEVRYYEKDGVTYRETRQVIQRQIPEVAYSENTQTVYRDQCTTELKDTVRTYLVPVTEYRLEPHLVGRWNPFIEPYYEYRSVPTVRWESRTEVVKVPVANRQLVPTTQVVRTPVTKWRTVEEEVINRVAVGMTASSTSSLASTPSSPAPSNVTLAGPLVPISDPNSSRRDQIGGLSRLDNDPPRQGASNTAGRPADDRFRR